jgi:hypothetical protein
MFPSRGANTATPLPAGGLADRVVMGWAGVRRVETGGLGTGPVRGVVVGLKRDATARP